MYGLVFFPARSKWPQYFGDAEELDRVEMRDADEADDANNRLETPSLGKQQSFMKIKLFFYRNRPFYIEITLPI